MTTFIENKMNELNESSIELNTEFSNTLEIGVRQLHKKQDYIVNGSGQDEISNRKFEWMLLADGHGSDACINRIRKFGEDGSLNEYMTFKSPMERVIRELSKDRYYGSSGATCNIVKIYPDGEIHCWSVGDSQVAIFVNGELQYMNCPHKMSNPKEVERLKTVIHTVQPAGLIPRITSSTTMHPEKSYYVNFSEYGKQHMIAMTQSLGHDGLTGYCPEYHCHKFNAAIDNIRVVVGSDGFWENHVLDSKYSQSDYDKDQSDILSMTVKELLDKTEARWKQHWKYYWDPNFPELFVEMPHEVLDDISIGIWTQVAVNSTACAVSSSNAVQVAVEQTIEDALLAIETLAAIESSEISNEVLDQNFEIIAEKMYQEYLANKQLIDSIETEVSAEIGSISAYANGDDEGSEIDDDEDYSDMPGLIPVEYLEEESVDL